MEGKRVSHLYASTLRQGPVLWTPEPNEELTLKYRREGVRIGDVGILRADGSFDFVFNVCHPANDEINRSNYGVPDDFEQLEWDGKKRGLDNVFRAGESILSRGAKKQALDVEGTVSALGVPVGGGSTGLTIQFVKDRGAVIIPPNGVNSVDCQNLAVFRNYAERHAASWYRFVNETLGREVENGTIYFVTGSDKTDCWENGFFSRNLKERMCEIIVNTGGLVGGPRQREGLQGTLNDIEAFVAQTRDSLVSRYAGRWLSGHRAKKHNEFLRRSTVQDFSEQDIAQQEHSKQKLEPFVPVGTSADRIHDYDVQRNRNPTAMEHESASSDKPHSGTISLGFDSICPSPRPTGPGRTPSDAGSSQSFRCEPINAADTMQAHLDLDTLIRRDDCGRIRLPSLDGCTSKTAQELADLVQEEIQTEATADADYPRECTKYLKGLFKIHRVLPASLFVNDVVRPKDKLRPVGGGGFTDIYTGLRGGKTVCLKVLRIYLENDTNKRDETIDTLYKEAVLWTQLKHPNILPFLGVNMELFSDYQFCIVTPWMMNGTILQFLKKNPSSDKLAIIREIASGIAYLHSRHVVHGDIKPTNILVDENGRCQLSDFGLAAIVSETSYLNTTMIDGQKGTLRYMAPESILSTTSPDENLSRDNKFAADVYAYASTVYEIITGQPPFSKLHEGLIIIHIMNRLSQPGERPTEAGTWCPDNVWTLIEKFASWTNWTTYRKGRRYTAEDLRALLSSAEGIETLLTIDGPRVPSVVDLLHMEIQRTASTQELREYRKRCTKCLRRLVDKHRVLPASLFVNDIKDVTLSSSFGGYSDIYRGTSRARPVCLKVLRVVMQEGQRREDKEDRAFRAFYKETLLWTQLSHPNLLPFLGVNTTKFPGRFCLVSPWMANGEIKNFLKNNPDHDKLAVIIEIAAGMAYLHSLDIVHGDIKGANVLVDVQGRCKLADFGLAVHAVASSLITSASGRKGTLRWMAPELLIGQDNDETPYDKKTKLKFGRDIYAYAMTVLEIITGQHPFPNIKHDAGVIYEVGMRDVRPDRPTTVDWCPDNIWTLIQHCWSKEIHLRPAANKIHSFLLLLKNMGHLIITWEQYCDLDPPFIDDVDIESPPRGTLSSGIYKGIFGGLTVGVKVLQVHARSEDGQDDGSTFRVFREETLLWTQLDHPNLLPFTGVNISTFPGRFCLVSPWMSNGEIKDFLRENPDHDRLTVITEIAAGIAYLHSRDLVHGNIKGANVLVNAQGQCQLADFGLAIFAVTNIAITSANGGNVRWMAPELLTGQEQTKFGCDIYAFAMTTLEILTGQHPFPHIMDEAVIINQVGRQGARPDRPSTLIWCPNAIWSLLQHCWAQQIDLRPTADRVYSLLLSLQTLRRSNLNWRNHVIVPTCPEYSPHDGFSCSVMPARIGYENTTRLLNLRWVLQLPSLGTADRRICFAPLDNYSREDAQELADLIQEEIQTKPEAADVGYREECTKFLQRLFDTYRVLPTSLFVSDVVRPGGKLQPVGRGGFSDIYTGLRGRQAVCLKVLRVSLENATNERDETINTLYKEAVLWTQLKHPNVLPFLGVNRDLFSVNQFCMVSPWMVNGSIVQFLEKNPDHDKLIMIREIASGIAYLHSCRVVHGDIKPVNILVDENGCCHLADFGLAAIVFETPYLNTSATDSPKTTLRYTAPESKLPMSYECILKVDKFAADVYAYACTILEIIGGRIINQLSQPGERPTEAEIWCPDNVWTLIEKCWDRDPQLRPKANEVQAFLERVEELRRLGKPWDQTYFDSDWQRLETD
ncbi:kinase-like protein [Marasmius fiardii PR-910]|nr:kinase-like protein [Marasmius fiardii PR-910]